MWYCLGCGYDLCRNCYLRGSQIRDGSTSPLAFCGSKSGDKLHHLNDCLIPTSFLGVEEANALARALSDAGLASRDSSWMDLESPPPTRRPGHGPQHDPAGIEWEPFWTFNYHKIKIDEGSARRPFSGGLAMVVHDVPFTRDLWTPASFMQCTTATKCITVDCRTGTSQEQRLVTFFQRFDHADRSRKLKVGSSQY